jgi:hypothetical protein
MGKHHAPKKNFHKPKKISGRLASQEGPLVFQSVPCFAAFKKPLLVIEERDETLLPAARGHKKQQARTENGGWNDHQDWRVERSP